MIKKPIHLVLLCLLLSAGDLGAHIPRPFPSTAFTDVFTETNDMVLKGVERACYRVSVSWWLDWDDTYPEERLKKEKYLENELEKIALPLLKEYDIELARCGNEHAKDTEAFIWLHASTKISESKSGAQLEINYSLSDRVQSLRTGETFRIEGIKIESVSDQVPLEELESRIRERVKSMVARSIDLFVSGSTN